MQIYLVMYAIRDVVVNDQQNPNRDADGIVNLSYSNFTRMVFVSGFLEGRPTAVKMMILVSNNNIQMDWEISPRIKPVGTNSMSPSECASGH